MILLSKHKVNYAIHWSLTQIDETTQCVARILIKISTSSELKPSK